MKKLEKKILDKVYRFETKKTVGQIVGELVGLVTVIFFGYIFISLFFDQVFQQGTFDLLGNFFDDWEIVKKYLADTIFIIFEETPKELLLLILVCLVILVILIYLFIKNFVKIRNRLIALVKFWFIK